MSNYECEYVNEKNSGVLDLVINAKTLFPRNLQLCRFLYTILQWRQVPFQRTYLEFSKQFPWLMWDH